MESDKKLPKPPNPKEGASILSALTFSWTFPLFWIGYKRGLTLPDLCAPLDEYDSKQLGDRLEELWNDELRRGKMIGKKRPPSLWKVLGRFLGCEIIFLTIGIFLLEAAFKLGQPILLGKFLNHFSANSTVSAEEATVYASGVAMSIFLYQFGTHPLLFGSLYLGMRVRVGLSALLYRKLLKISISSNAEVTGGYVVNLLTNDANQFYHAVLLLPGFFGGIIYTAFSIYFLWQQVGFSSIVGFAALALLIPIELLLARKSATLREISTKWSDRRIQLMNEIIQGIQAIKMYVWEKSFAMLVEVARRNEVKAIRSEQNYSAVVSACTSFVTKLSFFMCILHFAMSGNDITTEKIFTTIMYFNILFQSLYFPLTIKSIAGANVAMRRMQEFLLKPESTASAPNLSATGYSNVLLENVDAKWTYDQQFNSLENLNLSVTSGMLVAVTGQVGCGKSTLLQLLLREISYVSGNVIVEGSVSYASQKPWLFNGTVMQNILFGLPMDKLRYSEVVRACALEEDFKQLPGGDKTQVGEHGHSLSGGQKARVNLARAIYRHADIYLLDDPLSAVDTEVGRHIFDQCISKFLSGKTVILCTHQLQYLNNVELVIVMKKGCIIAQDNFAALQKTTTELSELANDISVVEGKATKEQLQIRFSSHDTESENEFDIRKEMKSKGIVAWKVYKSYFQTVFNLPTLLCLVLLFSLSQVASSAENYWTSYWVDLEERGFHEDGRKAHLPLLGELNQTKCLYVFGALIAFSVVVNLGNMFAFTNCFVAGSKTIHDKMFNVVSKATMSFFDTNPSGRILTRFSRDIGVIDESLPRSLTGFLDVVLQVLGVCCITAVVNYWLLLPMLVVSVPLAFLNIIFVGTSRSLERLEDSTCSPLYTHTNATLEGLVTVRSMNASDDLSKEFDSKMNTNSSARFYSLGTNQAFASWMDFICNVYTVTVIYSFLYLDGHFKGGEVGLTVTQAMSSIFVFQCVVQVAAHIDVSMSSVERVYDFLGVDSEEGRLSTKPNQSPPKDWPTTGDITFQNVSLRYDPTAPPVLKSLNVTIKSGETIGIVGRTGAGKSSLLCALFHLYPVEGKIFIDGIDTSEIGLEDLRSHLSVIPQEPVLFTGSLRQNLDPFEQYRDIDLWRVLQDVKLKPFVDETKEGLQFNVTEGGGNLSVGQRQLICLARAILRQNKILILDEATANMDTRTDQLVQATIRKNFAGCTVLTVAHRLNTVMDNDRILVMDAGQVAEFGTPLELLEKQNGLFTKLVNQTGPTNSSALRAMAELSN